MPRLPMFKGHSNSPRPATRTSLCQFYFLLFAARDAKMHHMKKATVRDLRYRFSAVEDLLREGEEIHITKRKRVIARRLPPKPPAPVRRPDFLPRMKTSFRKR